MPIFHNRAQPIRQINNSVYLIQATIPIERVSNVDDVKRYLGSDVAFKVNKEGVFYFCSEIQEAEYEEI